VAADHLGPGPAGLEDLAAAEEALAEVLELSLATSQAVDALQRRKLDALLAYASRHVPFYREFARRNRVSVLNDLPPVDKAALMGRLTLTCAEPGLDIEALRRHVAKNERERAFALFRDRYYVRRTSGTTGYVGFFLWDGPMSRVAETSATRFVPAPRDLPKPVVAVNPIVTWHPLQALFENLHALLLGTGLHRTVERLHELRPRTVMGSPAFVAELAEEQIEGRLRIRPEVVVVGSEHCSGLQRQRMRQAWSVEPLEQYGLSEAGLIASRCGVGNFHIHADTVVLEMLDQDGGPAREGQRCARTLLTRLFGPVQPIIRYELGDLIVVGPRRCPCGAPFPTIASIAGRMKPQMWFGAQAGGLLALSAYALVSVIENTPGVARYQIRYERPGTLEILLLAREPVDEASLVGRLEGELARRGAIPPRIVVSPGAVPSVWATSPMANAKDHHLRIAVTRAQVDDWLSARLGAEPL
jgi:phenylacetate-coenzyme A ligase PaaK-like adenylate-forming protein